MVVRHLDVAAAEEREGIVHGIGEARHAADVRTLTDALGTDRMMRRGRDRVVGLPLRRLDGGRDEEIHERATDHVADFVVADLLAHRDGERLGQSAVHLTLDDHRVDARAAVVERVKAPDLVDAGIDVDVHDAEVSAERVGHVRWIVVAHRFEARFKTWRWRIVGCPGDLLHALVFLGQTFHAEAVDVPLEIVLVHLEHVGGDHLRLGLDLARRHGDRCAGDRRRA